MPSMTTVLPVLSREYGKIFLLYPLYSMYVYICICIYIYSLLPYYPPANSVNYCQKQLRAAAWILTRKRRMTCDGGVEWIYKEPYLWLAGNEGMEKKMVI